MATAPIRPLAWELPFASGVALEKTEKTKTKKQIEGRAANHVYMSTGQPKSLLSSMFTMLTFQKIADLGTYNHKLWPLMCLPILSMVHIDVQALTS